MANAFSEANPLEPERETPPEEILLSELSESDANALDEDGLESRIEGDERLFRLRPPLHARDDVTGGDPDDDWYQAEVVGEEAVGGDNPTPDQNVTEDLLRSAGIASIDGQGLRTANKLERRDHARWELNPESAEDYQER